MSTGRINTDGKLEKWKADPTRTILPKEPNYAADAERFAQRQKEKAAEKRRKEKEEAIKKHGRGQKEFVIKDINFILPYSKYKGKPLAFAIKRDKRFVRNLVQSGDFQISDMVMNELRKRGIIN